jgi:hypothetical protein
MSILRADWQSALAGPGMGIGKRVSNPLQVANLPYLPAFLLTAHRWRRYPYMGRQ